MSEQNYVQGLAGVPAAVSSVSDIDGQKGILSYRGYDIADLVASANFEEVAYLLIYGDLPNQTQFDAFSDKLKNSRNINRYNIRQLMKNLPAETDSMTMLQIGCAVLGAYYDKADYRTGDDNADAYILDVVPNFISHVASIVSTWEHIRQDNASVQPDPKMSFSENLLYTLSGKQPTKMWVKLMDACLILHAEHSMNASTFTTLVSASSLSNPCAVLASSVASLSGPLHGGANEEVIKMLREVGSPENARSYIENKLSRGEVVWGIGHREYKVKDPRATILQNLTLELLEENSDVKMSLLYETALEVEKVCHEKLSSKGLYPNVDFYSGILYIEMGLNEKLFTPLFAIARTAGWLAHWREQMMDNRIFRPSQIYKGKKDRKYISIDKRSK